MRFRVCTSSRGRISSEEYATLVSKFNIKCVTEIDDFGHENEVFYVNINTLEELIQFIKETAWPCIITEEKEIEIYDYFRE